MNQTDYVVMTAKAICLSMMMALALALMLG